MTAALAPDEIEFYRREGYVVPRFALPAADVAALRDALDALIAKNPGVRPEKLVSAHIEGDEREGNGEGVRGVARFLELAMDERIVDVVAGAIGNDVVLWGCHVFCKPPHEGHETPWHQDGHYWPIRPLATCTVWVALEPSKVDNGCLRVLPRSHAARTLHPHLHEDRSDVALNQRLDGDAFDERDAVAIELEPGQMSLHDVFMIHGAEANRSPRRRTGVALRYMPATSLFDRSLKPSDGQTGVPVQFATRPIWLLRGTDRHGGNDFAVGHRPRPQFAPTMDETNQTPEEPAAPAQATTDEPAAPEAAKGDALSPAAEAAGNNGLSPAAETAGSDGLSPAACGALLAQHFPALFAAPQPLPIKLRIQADIQARAPGVFTKRAMSLFLHRWTTSTPYLKALVAAATRFDLDGQPAGEIAAEHRDAAVAELDRRRAIVQARRAAEREAQRPPRPERPAQQQPPRARPEGKRFERPRPPQRQAPQQAREQAREQVPQPPHRPPRPNAEPAAAARPVPSLPPAEIEARRDRATLLRAFETSTLTTANFCALKRITPAELEAQLTQARAERGNNVKAPR